MDRRRSTAVPTWALATVVCLQLASVRAEAEPSWLRQAFTRQELERAHPQRADGKDVYHGVVHSKMVSEGAGRTARRSGLSESVVRFVEQVGLVHDWDPGRGRGTPARVDATVRALHDDFAGRRSITGQAGRSVLRERFGWGETELAVAVAMIRRTQFPFDATARDRYREALLQIEGGAKRTLLAEVSGKKALRELALRQGATLSELVDKAGYYAGGGFGGSIKRVEALLGEMKAIGVEMTPLALRTSRFVSSLGQRASYEVDRQMARDLGLRFDAPSRKLLGRRGRIKLIEARVGYRAYERALERGASLGKAKLRGHLAVWGRRLRTVRRGLRGALRRIGVGRRRSTRRLERARRER